jgi:hypothetical protein
MSDQMRKIAVAADAQADLLEAMADHGYNPVRTQEALVKAVVILARLIGLMAGAMAERFK